MDRKQDLVFPSQGKAGDQPAGYNLSSHEATRNGGYQQQGERPDSGQSEGRWPKTVTVASGTSVKGDCPKGGGDTGAGRAPAARVGYPGSDRQRWSRPAPAEPICLLVGCPSHHSFLCLNPGKHLLALGLERPGWLLTPKTTTSGHLPAVCGEESVWEPWQTVGRYMKDNCPIRTSSVGSDLASLPPTCWCSLSRAGRSLYLRRREALQHNAWTCNSP